MSEPAYAMHKYVSGDDVKTLDNVEKFGKKAKARKGGSEETPEIELDGKKLSISTKKGKKDGVSKLNYESNPEFKGTLDTLLKDKDNLWAPTGGGSYHIYNGLDGSKDKGDEAAKILHSKLVKYTKELETLTASIKSKQKNGEEVNVADFLQMEFYRVNLNGLIRTYIYQSVNKDKNGNKVLAELSKGDIRRASKAVSDVVADQDIQNMAASLKESLEAGPVFHSTATGGVAELAMLKGSFLATPPGTKDTKLKNGDNSKWRSLAEGKTNKSEFNQEGGDWVAENFATNMKAATAIDLVSVKENADKLKELSKKKKDKDKDSGDSEEEEESGSAPTSIDTAAERSESTMDDKYCTDEKFTDSPYDKYSSGRSRGADGSMYNYKCGHENAEQLQEWASNNKANYPRLLKMYKAAIDTLKYYSPDNKEIENLEKDQKEKEEAWRKLAEQLGLENDEKSSEIDSENPYLLDFWDPARKDFTDEYLGLLAWTADFTPFETNMYDSNITKPLNQKELELFKKHGFKRSTVYSVDGDKSIIQSLKNKAPVQLYPITLAEFLETSDNSQTALYISNETDVGGKEEIPDQKDDDEEDLKDKDEEEEDEGTLSDKEKLERACMEEKGWKEEDLDKPDEIDPKNEEQFGKDLEKCKELAKKQIAKEEKKGTKAGETNKIDKPKKKRGFFGRAIDGIKKALGIGDVNKPDIPGKENPRVEKPNDPDDEKDSDKDKDKDDEDDTSDKDKSRDKRDHDDEEDSGDKDKDKEEASEDDNKGSGDKEAKEDKKEKKIHLLSGEPIRVSFDIEDKFVGPVYLNSGLTTLPIGPIGTEDNRIKYDTEADDAKEVMEDALSEEKDEDKDKDKEVDPDKKLYHIDKMTSQQVNANHLLLWNAMRDKAYKSTALRDDMDKPLYMDFMGNILTASGYVVIPAAANYSYYLNGARLPMFNAMFINGYPDVRTDGSGNYARDGVNREKYMYFLSTGGVAKYVITNKLGNSIDKEVPALPFRSRVAYDQGDYQVDADFMKVGPNFKTAFETFKFASGSKGAMNDLVFLNNGIGFEETGEVRNFSDMREISGDGRSLQWGILKDVNKANLSDKTSMSRLNMVRIATSVAVSDTSNEIFENNYLSEAGKLLGSAITKATGEVFENIHNKLINTMDKNILLYTPTLRDLPFIGNGLGMITPYLIVITLILFVYVVVNFSLSVISGRGYTLSQLLFSFLAIVVSILFIVWFSPNAIDTLYNKPPEMLLRGESMLYIMEDVEGTHRGDSSGFFSPDKPKIDNDRSQITLAKLNNDDVRSVRDAVGISPKSRIFYYRPELDTTRVNVLGDKVFLEGTRLKMRTKDLLNIASIEDVTDADGNVVMDASHKGYSELGYYTPYFNIMATLTDNINEFTKVTDTTYRLLALQKGESKTTGRAETFFNSVMFISPELIRDYRDHVSLEDAVMKYNAAIGMYDNARVNDFLNQDEKDGNPSAPIVDITGGSGKSKADEDKENEGKDEEELTKEEAARMQEVEDIVRDQIFKSGRIDSQTWALFNKLQKNKRRQKKAFSKEDQDDINALYDLSSKKYKKFLIFNKSVEASDFNRKTILKGKVLPQFANKLPPPLNQLAYLGVVNPVGADRMDWVSKDIPRDAKIKLNGREVPLVVDLTKEVEQYLKNKEDSALYKRFKSRQTATGLPADKIKGKSKTANKDGTVGALGIDADRAVGSSKTSNSGKGLTDTFYNDELSEQNIEKLVTAIGGDVDDWLGLKRVLLIKEDPYLFPEATHPPIINSLWFQKAVTKGVDDQETSLYNPQKEEDTIKKIHKINKETKNFVLSYLAKNSSSISDESLIKVTTLYATMAFNREFSTVNNQLYPKTVELSELSNDYFYKMQNIPQEDYYTANNNQLGRYLAEKGGMLFLLLGIFNAFLDLIRTRIRLVIISVMLLSLPILTIFMYVIKKDDKINNYYKGVAFSSAYIFVVYLFEILSFKTGCMILNNYGVTLALIFALLANLLFTFLYAKLALMIVSDLSSFGSFNIRSMVYSAFAGFHGRNYKEEFEKFRERFRNEEEAELQYGGGYGGGGYGGDAYDGQGYQEPYYEPNYDDTNYAEEYVDQPLIHHWENKYVDYPEEDNPMFMEVPKFNKEDNNPPTEEDIELSRLEERLNEDK